MSETNGPLPLEIQCSKVNELLGANNFLLLDCREQDEYDTAKIEDATLIPMSEIQNRISELQPHREKHIVIHCHLGGRSLQVTHWLRQNGFEKTQSMEGGIDAWSQQIDITVPRY